MSSSAPNCPIAIVGMACRYPDADTVEELFVNSLAQRRSFRRIPETRLSAAYFDETGTSGDRAYARQAAVLKDLAFDRDWFRTSRTTYEETDLTHRLALTVARETIDDIRSGKRGAHPDNDAVRVIVGNTLTGEFSRASLMRLRWPYVRSAVIGQLREQMPELGEAERDRLLSEIEDRGQELVYNLTIIDEARRPVERWRRLTLRAVGEQPGMRLNSPALMAPFFERQVAALMPEAELKVSVVPMSMDVRMKRRAPASDRRADGKPDSPNASRFRSASYGGNGGSGSTAPCPPAATCKPCRTCRKAIGKRCLARTDQGSPRPRRRLPEKTAPLPRPECGARARPSRRRACPPARR